LGTPHLPGADLKPPIPRSCLRAAWVLALLVDGMQILCGPLATAGPLAWILGAGLDLLTAALMWFLVGWHWAFLPSFLIEIFPIADIAPTWTLALLVASRGRRGETPGPS